MRETYILIVKSTADTRRQAANQIQAIVRNWPVSHIDSILKIQRSEQTEEGPR